MAAKKDPRLARAGVSGYNKPKRTPGHATKSHVVVAKEGDKVKTIRFGQQGVKGLLKHVMPRTLVRARCQRPTGPTKLSGENMPRVAGKSYPYTKAGKAAAAKAKKKVTKKKATRKPRRSGY